MSLFAVVSAYLVIRVHVYRTSLPGYSGGEQRMNASVRSSDHFDIRSRSVQRSKNLATFLLAAHQPRVLGTHRSWKSPPVERAPLVMKAADEINEALGRRELFATFGFATAALALSAETANALEEESFNTASSNPVSHALDITELLAASDGAAAIDVSSIFQKSARKALGSGKAGAAAAVVQVCSLMWLRTAMNYQYRYGGNLSSALNTLMNEGGIGRLYKGLPFALVQGPLSRFGDTATNIGVIALLESFPETAGLPLPVKTAVASVAAGLWRILCMPIDTSKTALQVEGEEGLKRLKDEVLQRGPAPLYRGSIASATATFAGNYPWFLTYNFLGSNLPLAPENALLLSLLRSAFQGFAASAASDTISNSFRVVKTTQQTAALDKNSQGSLSIPDAFKLVLEEDGVQGLLGRGLKTRLLTNAIQGAAFSVLWKYFQAGGPTGPP